MREAAVKSAIFVGVPRVRVPSQPANVVPGLILACAMCYGPQDDPELGSTNRGARGRCEDVPPESVPSVRQYIYVLMLCLTRYEREANAKNIERLMQRGRDLWKDIYTPHDVKLANKLASYHPDFICGYT